MDRPREQAVCHRFTHDRIVVGLRPAAVLKAAAAVLVGPARCLHHAIKCQVFDHNNFHFVFFAPAFSRVSLTLNFTISLIRS